MSLDATPCCWQPSTLCKSSRSCSCSTRLLFTVLQGPADLPDWYLGPEPVPDRSEALREVPDLLMLLFLHPGTIGPICDFMELPLLHMEMLTV